MHTRQGAEVAKLQRLFLDVKIFYTEKNQCEKMQWNFQKCANNI